MTHHTSVTLNAKLCRDLIVIVQAPALTVIARRRNSQSLAYPVGLRRRNSRAAGLGEASLVT